MNCHRHQHSRALSPLTTRFTPMISSKGSTEERLQVTSSHLSPQVSPHSWPLLPSSCPRSLPARAFLQKGAPGCSSFLFLVQVAAGQRRLLRGGLRRGLFRP